MWPEFIHHLTLHFAIVLPMALAAVGTYEVRGERASLVPVVRWGGMLALTMTSLAVISGLIAGGFSGGEPTLQHHRYLGILTWIVVAMAAVGYDHGVRRDIGDLRTFGVGLWWVASFAVIGAGHWGGITEHTDVVPF